MGVIRCRLRRRLRPRSSLPASRLGSRGWGRVLKVSRWGGHDHAADEGVKGVFACKGCRRGRSLPCLVRLSAFVGGVRGLLAGEIGGACGRVGLVDGAGVEAGVHFHDERLTRSWRVEGPDPEACLAQGEEHRHAAKAGGANGAGAADLEDGFWGNALDALGAVGVGDEGGEFAINVGGAEHAVNVLSGELGWTLVGLAPEAAVEAFAVQPLLAALRRRSARTLVPCARRFRRRTRRGS